MVAIGFPFGTHIYIHTSGLSFVNVIPLAFYWMSFFFLTNPLLDYIIYYYSPWLQIIKMIKYQFHLIIHVQKEDSMIIRLSEPELKY
jgi:hypothetical protein